MWRAKDACRRRAGRLITNIELILSGERIEREHAEEAKSKHLAEMEAESKAEKVHSETAVVDGLTPSTKRASEASTEACSETAANSELSDCFEGKKEPAESEGGSDGNVRCNEHPPSIPKRCEGRSTPSALPAWQGGAASRITGNAEIRGTSASAREKKM